MVTYLITDVNKRSHCMVVSWLSLLGDILLTVLMLSCFNNNLQRKWFRQIVSYEGVVCRMMIVSKEECCYDIMCQLMIESKFKWCFADCVTPEGMIWWCNDDDECVMITSLKDHVRGLYVMCITCVLDCVRLCPICSTMICSCVVQWLCDIKNAIIRIRYFRSHTSQSRTSHRA